MRSLLPFLRGTSRFFLFLEQSFLVWLPLAAGFLSIAVLGMLGFWSSISPWFHALVLLFCLIAAIRHSWKNRARLRYPSRAAADRWLETHNQLPHQPLLALEDRPVISSDAPLWQLHRERALAALKRLRPAWPSLPVAARDRFALRAPLLLFLVIGYALVGSEFHLRDAFLPAIQSPYLGDGATVEARVTPPGYTGKTVTVLTSSSQQPVEVPEGSVLDLRVRGSFWTPRLRAGETRIAMKRDTDGSYHATATITGGSRITASAALRTLADWRVKVIADLPPVLGVLKMPEKTVTGAMKIEFDAEDDYGVTGASAVIAFDANAGMSIPPTEELTLDLPANGRKKIQAPSYHEVGFHDLAGLPVTMRIEAQDAAGHMTRGPEVKFILPEAEFRHPVAKAIIAERKKLETTPAPREEVSIALGMLASKPGSYGGDLITFLALDTASLRLAYDMKGRDTESVRLMLWRTAVHVEQAGTAEKRDALRQAMQKLKEALASGKTSEINHAWQEAMRRMREFLEARAKSMPENMQTLQRLQAANLAQAMQQMLDTATTGNRDQAQEMLNRIEQAMEESPAMTLPPALLQKALETAAALSKLRKDQAQLKQDTTTPQQQSQSLQQRQQSLAKQANQVSQALKQCQGGGLALPGGEALGSAKEAMARAAQALENGNRLSALAAQQEALDKLNEAMDAMKSAMQGKPGQGGMPMGLGFGLESFMGDENGTGLFGTIKVPDEGTLQRSRRIQQELQRRAGERDRPQTELEYIDRLLEMY
ncbi:MAG: DUF4175 family protein [Alphaproteobacteria bacterium]|nr:DUF4175 family protein [Alphaproteobacteria bacterium]